MVLRFPEVLYWCWVLWILCLQAWVCISWEEAVWGTSWSDCFSGVHPWPVFVLFLYPRVLLCRLPSLPHNPPFLLLSHSYIHLGVFLSPPNCLKSALMNWVCSLTFRANTVCEQRTFICPPFWEASSRLFPQRSVIWNTILALRVQSSFVVC